MVVTMFFSGLVAGFLIGWGGIAFLTMANLRNLKEDMSQAMGPQELVQSRPEGS